MASLDELNERVVKLEVIVHEYFRQFQAHMDEENNNLAELKSQVGHLTSEFDALKGFIRGAVAVLGVIWAVMEVGLRVIG